MTVVRPKIDADYLAELRQNKNSVQNFTHFNFLQQHNGLRPGKLHLVLGMPSGGKSTLRNSLIIDHLKNNSNGRVFLYLSEESEAELASDLSELKVEGELLRGLVIYSEQDRISQVTSTKDKASFMAQLVAKSGCSLFIFDNLTTSQLYGEQYSEQSTFCYELKTQLSKLKSATVLLAHTQSGIKGGHDGIIDMNDVRGSKTVTNIAQFQYVMQGFEVQRETINTVRICKHRGYNVEDKFFMFNFNRRQRVYDKDVGLNFDQFKSLYEKQNRLKKPR